MKRSGFGLEKIKNKVERLTNQNASVGWYPSAKYPDGTSVAEVMKRHVYGFGVPMRDPLRPPMRGAKNILTKVLSKEIKKGSVSPYNAVCEKAVAVVKTGFKQLQAPPLAASTIRARRNRRKTKNANSKTISKPLIDTAVAVNSVTYEVR